MTKATNFEFEQYSARCYHIKIMEHRLCRRYGGFIVDTQKLKLRIVNDSSSYILTGNRQLIFENSLDLVRHSEVERLIVQYQKVAMLNAWLES